MSEAMSSGEIEDVLSSIRRLVSEDLRPASQTGAKPVDRAPEAPAAPLPLSRIVAPDTPAPEPKKLLLTPALRVVTSDPESAAASVTLRPTAPLYRPQSTAPKETDGRDDGLFGTIDLKPRKSSQDMNDVVSTIATAVDEADSQWESETGDASFEGLDWETPLWEEDRSETPATKEEPEADTRMDAPAADADAPVVEEGLVDLPEDLEQESVSQNAMSLTAEDWEASEDTDPTLAEEAAIPQFSRRFLQDVSDKAEAEAVAEILRATQAEHFGKEDPEDRGYSDTASAYDVDQDADGAYSENQGGYFDEAVLRDLVRDLIREELGGTLGERITRNVRKLVRAEINRALTARDFE